MFRVFSALLLLTAAAHVRAAQPVTITFEDLNSKPFGHDWLPPFLWKGVRFEGGGLHRSDSLGTGYQGRNRSVIHLGFPAGSTDVSFDVDGYGTSYFPQARKESMPIQVWLGNPGYGLLVATLPIPASGAPINPPTQTVTVPGPLVMVSIFTAPELPGAYDYDYLVNIDNIRYTPPDPEPSIAFDPVLPEHTRVLTHNYGDYPYPSILQSQDGAIRVQATILVNNQPAPGKTIHFRVTDPADSAPYVTRAGDDHLGDNFDGPGSLNGTGKPTAAAVSDGAGRVAVTLNVTSFASGDNYQIEASANETFPCGASCVKSAVYTAWKRVYVEYNKMFRRGAFLTDDVPAGAKEIPVDDVRNLPDVPFTVRLLHAAMIEAPAAGFATEERVTVIAIEQRKEGTSKLLGLFSVGPQPGILILDPDPGVPGLQRAYAGPEEVKKQARTYLADAVGVVTGTRAADFLLADGTLMNAPFDPAFTDYVWLTDAEGSDPDLLFTQHRLPYDGVVPPKQVVGGEGLDQWQREWLTRKWLRHAGRQGIERVADANHQALFTLGSFWKPAASLSMSYGMTSVGSNFNDTWLPVLAIGNQTMVAEATVHELAHQWRVNHGGVNPGALDGHCGYVGQSSALTMAGEAAKFCTMTKDLYQYPDARDGKVGFHYRKFGGVVDSEFIRIRRRPDPVPQNENQRETPQ